MSAALRRRSRIPAILLWIAGFFPGVVLAHAALVGSTPSDQAVLEAPPADVRFRFNEPITLIAARVLGPAGREIAAGGRIEDQTLVITLPPGSSDGSYIASYRIVSADSHPVSGSIVFSVHAPTAAVTPGVEKADESNVRQLKLLLRALYIASLFAAAGGALFSLLVTRRPPAGALARWISGSAAAAVALALGGIGIHGADLLGSGLDGVTDGAAWDAALASTRGHALIAGVVAAMLLALAPWLSLRASAALSVTGAAIGAASFAMSGHSATAEPRALAAALWFLHVSCAAFWLGSLVPLLFSLQKESPAATRALARFSGLALLAVPVLLGAGVTMLVLLVRNPIALAGSEYGSLFGLKLSLVATMLALAVFNRLRLSRVATGDERARALLKRTIGAEVVLGLAILGTTAVFSSTEPPRKPAASAAASARLVSGEFAAEVGVSREGERRQVVVRLIHDGAHLWTPLEMAVELSRAGAGIEPLRRPLAPQPDGSYAASIDGLPVGGVWNIEIEALLSEFSKQRFTGSVVLP